MYRKKHEIAISFPGDWIENIDKRVTFDLNQSYMVCGGQQLHSTY